MDSLPDAPSSSLGRPDLLYVVHRVPYPPDKGDRLRNLQLLKYLSRRASIHLACLADEPVTSESIAELAKYCTRLTIAPLGSWRWVRSLASLASGRTASEGAFYSANLRQTIRQWARTTRFHACLASSSSVAPYLRVPELQRVPAVVDLVDVDSQKWLEYANHARGPKGWIYRLEGLRLRRVEQSLTTWANAITLVSQEEVDLLRGFGDFPMAQALPNGVDLEYFQPGAFNGDADPSCAFVGALNYRPNVDGAIWFCEQVWPGVRKQYPHAKFYLVGRQPAKAVQNLASIPGVVLVGQVPDVRPYVAQATVIVAPLLIARGVQNKVLEALAMAKAAVISPQALTGLGIRPDEHVLCAATPVEWISAICLLFRDPKLCQRLGQAGRTFVEEEHRWERCLSSVSPLLGLNPMPAATQEPQLA